jgi:hypothetical protein
VPNPFSRLNREDRYSTTTVYRDIIHAYSQLVNDSINNILNRLSPSILDAALMPIYSLYYMHTS